MTASGKVERHNVHNYIDLRVGGCRCTVCGVEAAAAYARAYMDAVRDRKKTDEENYSMLECAPNLSKYHGQNGFEVERFIADYTAWKAAI